MKPVRIKMEKQNIRELQKMDMLKVVHLFTTDEKVRMQRKK